MSHEITSDVTRPASDDNQTHCFKPRDRSFGNELEFSHQIFVTKVSSEIRARWMSYLPRTCRAEWNDAAVRRNVKSQSSDICPHRMAVAQKITLTDNEISVGISGFPFNVKAHNRGEEDQ